jgi:dUTP pyrophosphatase
MKVQIQVKDSKVIIPKYATVGSAAFDLIAHNFKEYYQAGNSPKDVAPNNIVYMYPGSRLFIGCGFKMAIPEGYVLDVRPRSGLALKNGITVLNSPGTIDSDYRGEVCVVLVNHSQDSVAIALGMKIAQAVLIKVEQAELEIATELSTTVRGEGGFGSTGK